MRKLRNRKGQSIVEITLMTPLILVALYVPFDFGVSIFTAHITQNAVRDGARVASYTDPITNAVATTLANQVYNNLPPRLQSRSVTVRYYAGGASNCAEYVEVTAQGTYSFFLYKLMGILGIPVPDGVVITRLTSMRHVHQPVTNGGTGSTTTMCSTVTATGSR